ncbi:MAG: hypothetical protein Q8L88_04545 [Bacteroidota bacterium]|nr:hypothetical protein [Bacteroidota bacterium]
MKKTNTFFYSATILILFTTTVWGQSGREYRKVAVMNGNQVRTVFGNWGVIGQPGESGPRGAWKNDNNGYLGDASLLVGAEINWRDPISLKDTTFHSVATCPTGRPTQLRDEDPNTGKQWTFEPIAGYVNSYQEKIAISTNPNSWPATWPDKLNDTKDPGWKGSWNGYFGKRINADQESYFAMDDNNDERFNVSANNIFKVNFKPDSTKLSRNGMGLEVRVRGMQWNDFLAKDNIFWLYEITNTGTTNYDKVVLGMVIGTYVGVTGNDGGPQEYNDDWSFYDPFNNLTYTGDYKHGGPSRNPLWVGKVGMVGYAFLESPGNPFDGIDNDDDAGSSTIGKTAPLFTEKMFTDSIEISVGKQIVIINSDFSRSLYTVPNVDSVIIPTKGNKTYVFTGKNPSKKSYVQEGNVLKSPIVAIGDYVNPNAYDGIDNNYNGLIDENQYLHFRQVKKSGTVVLIDIPHVVHYVNYVSGQGKNPVSMLDEKRNDGIDNNENWNFKYDDLGRDGIANTSDAGEGDGLATSGYLANGVDTDLPGEAHIDKTDVNESDQIGLTSFYYFSPANNFKMGDKEAMWGYLAPGFFAVPDNIISNEPVAGSDGDFIYGSGYFPLLAKSTERFSIALVYGGGYGGSWPSSDIADLLKNKKTVQQIYDANYQFPLPPDKPILTAVAGDKQVTLYWDRKSEESVDPVLLIKDFEGYKIYKSTDPNFSDIFTITDASGIPQFYKAIAQFDLRDGIKGFYQGTPDLYQQVGGLSYFMGNDSGLVHSFVDKDVENGRRYYYALVAYDKGNESIGLFPKENTKFITIQPNGEITHDVNVAVVTPNAKTAGYDAAADTATLKRKTGLSNGTISYKVLDQTKLAGHTYQLSFLDTQNDTLDNNGNGIKDAADSTEWNRITSLYSVKDLTVLTESFNADDTLLVTLQRKNFDKTTIVVRDVQNNIVASSKYDVDERRGHIHGSAQGTLPKGKYTISYQYYPVWRSPFIQNSPYTIETKDADNFDGLQLIFKNIWSIDVDRTNSFWTGVPLQYNFSLQGEELFGGAMKLYRKPSDYEFQFYSTVVDSSTAHPDYAGILDQLPTKFRIYNVTDSVYIKFYYYSASGTGVFSSGDQIIFLEKGINQSYVPSWTLYTQDTSNYVLNNGSTLKIKTIKPFNSSDLFEFNIGTPKSDFQFAKQNPLRVRVVPNPYITASSFELPLNPGITSGRNRKIDITHLPAGAVVKIFTARGDHVITLTHDGNIENGTVSWNLKSKENLDVAFGVYFYTVESPAGNQTGKFAIIK